MTTNTAWHVRVDIAPRRVDEDSADELLDALGDLRPGIILDDEALIIEVHLEAPTLRQAIATALQRVESATGAKATGVEAITREEVERRILEPLVPDLVGYAEIAEILSVSRQRAAQLGDRPDFPPAVVTTKAGPLRVRAAVEAWATTWERKGGRPRKTTDE